MKKPKNYYQKSGKVPVLVAMLPAERERIRQAAAKSHGATGKRGMGAFLLALGLAEAERLGFHPDQPAVE